MNDRDALRVAFIASAGGSVIDALCRMVSEGLARMKSVRPVGVITDRACGAEEVAARHDLSRVRIKEPGESEFADAAAVALDRWLPDLVVLLFLRRVGPVIWRARPTWNLHPTLLPAHKGIGGLERSYEHAAQARARGEHAELGTTLHVVTGDLDAGPILAQARFTIEDCPTLDDARHVSFLQKVILLAESLARASEAPEGTLPTMAKTASWSGGYRPWRPDASILRAVAALARPSASRALNLTPMEQTA